MTSAPCRHGRPLPFGPAPPRARPRPRGGGGGPRKDKKLGLRESLPSAPGVYLMKGRGGEVLYVGKAVNLRRRVRAYFGPNGRHGRQIGRALAALDHVDHEGGGAGVEALG